MKKMVIPWNQDSKCSINQINQMKVDSQCPIRQAFFENSHTLANGEKQVIKINGLVLQLRQSYITLYDQQCKQIIDFFECNISISFAIREARDFYQQSTYIDNQQKRTFFFIQFTHNDYPQHQPTFIVSMELKKNLEYLGIALEKCQIIQKDFHSKFKPIRKLAKGSTASVFSAVRLRDSKIVAIKAFNKSSHFAMSNGKGKKAFEKEIKILIQCGNQNLCQFEGIFETGNTIYIAMKNYDKTLSSVMHFNRPLSRRWITSVMEDLLRSVAYLHNKGIMHRDLKLENIMLQQSQAGTKAIIIDLGMAEYFQEKSYLFEQCGTPGYAAPQIFGPRSSQPQKCDIFSLGVVFYLLLFKKTIFEGVNKQEILLNNKAGNLSIDMDLLNAQDEEIKDLLLQMLEVDHSKRISASEALSHDLFSSKIMTPTHTTTSLEMSHIKMLSLEEI